MMTEASLRKRISEGWYPELVKPEQAEGFVLAALGRVKRVPESRGALSLVVDAGGREHEVTLNPETRAEGCTCGSWRNSRPRKRCVGIWAAFYDDDANAPAVSDPREGVAREPRPPEVVDAIPVAPAQHLLPRHLTEDRTAYAAARWDAACNEDEMIDALLRAYLTPSVQRRRGRKRLADVEKFLVAYRKANSRMSLVDASAQAALALKGA